MANFEFFFLTLDEVHARRDTLGLKWDRLTGVTKDGCPNFTGKKVGILKHMQDKVTEIDADQKLVFLHCIIHQHVLCKSVLKTNHVIDVKIVNFIMARALNHRQFVTLLEEDETEHCDRDRLLHSCQMAQPGQNAKKSVGSESRNWKVLWEER